MGKGNIRIENKTAQVLLSADDSSIPLAEEPREAFGSLVNRYTIQLIGIIVASAMFVISAAMNFRFGMTLGTSQIDNYLYAFASLSADGFKALLPFIIIGLIAGRYRLMAVGAAVIWLLCIGWSMASAIGFASSTRDATSAERAATSDMRRALQDRAKRLEENIALLPPSRPAQVISAEISNTSIPRNVWLRTRECSEVTREDSLLACKEVLDLRKELAIARQAEGLENELKAIRDELSGIKVVGERADPQAETIASLVQGMTRSYFNLEIGAVEVRNMLAVLITFLIEAGSSLGFTIIAISARGMPRRMVVKRGSGRRRAERRLRRHIETLHFKLREAELKRELNRLKVATKETHLLTARDAQKTLEDNSNDPSRNETDNSAVLVDQSVEVVANENRKTGASKSSEAEGKSGVALSDLGWSRLSNAFSSGPWLGRKRQSDNAKDVDMGVTDNSSNADASATCDTPYTPPAQNTNQLPQSAKDSAENKDKDKDKEQSQSATVQETGTIRQEDQAGKKDMPTETSESTIVASPKKPADADPALNADDSNIGDKDKTKDEQQATTEVKVPERPLADDIDDALDANAESKNDERDVEQPDSNKEVASTDEIISETADQVATKEIDAGENAGNRFIQDGSSAANAEQSDLNSSKTVNDQITPVANRASLETHQIKASAANDLSPAPAKQNKPAPRINVSGIKKNREATLRSLANNKQQLSRQKQ